MANLTVGCLNVRGLNNKLKRSTIYRKAHLNRYGVFLLQETYCKKEDEDIWSAEWGGKCSFNNGAHNSRGVAILFSPKLNVKILQKWCDLGWTNITFASTDR